MIEENTPILDPSRLCYRMIIKDGVVTQLFESVGITHTKYTLFQGTLAECIAKAIEKDYSLDLADFGIEQGADEIEIPTMDWLKNDIQDFMNIHGIDFLESDTKSELITKINQHFEV